MEELITLEKPGYIKNRKRVGRGTSSGHGKTSCRGQKGQKSRSGSKSRAWFEGGQMPLYRRLPKRGFTNPFKNEFQIIDLSDIFNIEGTELTPDLFVKNKLIKKTDKLIKVLGKCEYKSGKKVYADAFSATAKNSIETAGSEAVIRKLKSTKEQQNND
jgi:large subunit ribosomal protein L15